MRVYIKQLPRRIRSAVRDGLNILRYGYRFAPRCFETIWINPLDVHYLCNVLKRRASGKVIDGDWDQVTSPLEDHPKIAACRKHFVDGLSWADSGIYELIQRRMAESGEFDRCSSMEDVYQRYAELDGLYQRLKSGEPYKTVREVEPGKFREKGGVVIHIGRNGELLFGGGGYHRLAIARALALEKIPVQIGACHPAAVKAGVVSRLREAGPC